MATFSVTVQPRCIPRGVFAVSCRFCASFVAVWPKAELSSRFCASFVAVWPKAELSSFSLHSSALGLTFCHLSYYTNINVSLGYHYTEMHELTGNNSDNMNCYADRV